MTEARGRRVRKRKPLALDRSLRSVDADGHMRVDESRISKANVCPYLGREIPDWERLGLQPDRTYKLFRDPEELRKGASSFDGKPLLITHVPIDAELPRKDLWVGTIGQTTFEDPYLVTRPLMVLTQQAIDLINSGEQRELSAAYRYDAQMVPGTYGGETYDGKMVNIRGNHVAIVTEGRVGPDVHVADELPQELRAMKTASAVVAHTLKPYLGTGAKVKLIQMALDAMLGETPAESVISLDEAEMKKAEDEATAEKQKAEGADASLTDEERDMAHERARDRKAKDKKARDKKAKDKAAKDKAARDAAGAAGCGEDGDPDPAADADPDHRKDFEPAKDAVTKDELPKILAKQREELRTQFRELAVAREAVRPLVGAVSVAMDSAEDVYKFALKHAGVKTDGVHASALPALVEMAVSKASRPNASSRVAMDTASSEVDLDAIFSPAKAAA